MGRLVTWSDGSKSLVIGREVFDINSTRLPNHYLYAKCETADSAFGGDNLFQDEDEEGGGGRDNKFVKFEVAKCQGQLSTLLKVQPNEATSRASARNVAMKHIKTTSAKIAVAGFKRAQEEAMSRANTLSDAGYRAKKRRAPTRRSEPTITAENLDDMSSSDDDGP